MRRGEGCAPHPRREEKGGTKGTKKEGERRKDTRKDVEKHKELLHARTRERRGEAESVM
jgi:hypothetical protein